MKEEIFWETFRIGYSDRWRIQVFPSKREEGGGGIKIVNSETQTRLFQATLGTLRKHDADANENVNKEMA